MTKQQQIEELDEEINELRRILDKKNEIVAYSKYENYSHGNGFI